MTLSVKTLCIMLCVEILKSPFIYSYAACNYAECRYAECRYAECRYAGCSGAPWSGCESARYGKRTLVRCNFKKVVKSIFLQIKNENCHNVEDCISLKTKL
jgi:hypothetical protein